MLGSACSLPTSILGDAPSIFKLQLAFTRLGSLLKSRADSTVRRIPALDYVEFLTESLGDKSAAELYSKAEAASDRAAKVVLHQTARLITLADWMEEVAPKRPALKIFFMVLAEAVAKIAFGFTGEGESRSMLHRFFDELCSSADRELLAQSFRQKETRPHTFVSASETIDILYGVRSSVVHRGEYFDFNLLEPGDVATITRYKDRAFEALLSVCALREVVIRGALFAANRLLTSP